MKRAISYFNSRKDRSARKARSSGRKVLFETLEPRLLLSSDLAYAGTSAFDLTLRLDQTDPTILQLIDNANSDAVVAQQALVDTSAVMITGSAENDRLTIDLSSPFILPGGIIFSDTTTLDHDTLELIGKANTWTITGADSGDVDGGGGIHFTGIENLTGGANDDRFVLGGGSISGVVDGASGTNTLDYSANTLGVTVDLGSVMATDTGGIANIQNVVGGVGDDIITGDDAANILIGGLGNDLLKGGKGNDALTGNEGNDILEAGQGADSVDGGLGVDTLQTNNGLANTWQVKARNAGLLNTHNFVDIENLIGDTAEDEFIFDDGMDITGALDGGLGSNTLNYAAYLAGIIVDLKSGQAQGTAGVSNIQHVTSGAGHDTLIGDDQANRLSGGAGDDTLIGNAGADTFIGSEGSDTLVAENIANTWSISASNSGTLNDETFSGIENLSGGDAADTFVLSAGATVSGVIDGGAGSDTLQAADTENLWTISGSDAGTLNTQAFASIENLSGGTLADTFIFAAGGSISGIIDGGDDDDTLVAYDLANTWAITASNSGTLNGQNFTGIENLRGGSAADSFIATSNVSGTLDGGAGDDTMTGPDSDSTFTLTASNVGVLSGLFNQLFSNIEHLIGGSGSDRFAINGAGGLSGEIDGGAGANTLDYTLASFADGAFVSLTAGVSSATAIGGLRNIQNIRGSDKNDRFQIDLSATSALPGSLNFDGGNGSDILEADGADSSWNITGPDTGTLGGHSFTGIENLFGGSGADTFIFDSAAQLSGTLDGNTGSDNLDYSARSSGVTIDLAAGTATDAGSISNIENLVTGAGDDSILGALGATSIDTGLGTDTLDFSNVTTDLTLTIHTGGMVSVSDGINSINNARGVDNLVGGSGTNTYVIENGASLTGNITGTANLNLSAYTTDITVNLNTATATGVSGTIENIQSVIGGSGNNTLIGTSATSTWNINGLNSGDVNGISFSNIQNLSGGLASDSFVFSDGAYVGGAIDGGTGADTLDHSAATQGVTINLGPGTNSVTNVETVIGGSGNNTLIGTSATSTWNINGLNSGDVNGIGFSNIQNLSGGVASDSFVFGNGAYVGGAIDGGTGADTLDHSAATQGVTVNLGPGANSVTNVETVIGGSGSDTLIGPATDATWNLVAQDSGSVAGVSFAGIENLSGGLGADRFVFADGSSVQGTIDGGDGADTVDYSAYSTAITARLGSVGGGIVNAENIIGSLQEDTLLGHSADSTWTVSGSNSGTVAGLVFAGFENLTGAADNEDTFVFTPGGVLSGSIEGGAGGFDSLVVEGGAYSDVILSAAGPNSGTVSYDGTVIVYSGLEPIDFSSTVAGTVTVEITNDDVNDLVLSAIDATTIRLDDSPASLVDTIEEHIISLIGLTSLIIDLGGGEDSLVISSTMDLGVADLSVFAESITLDATADITTTGDITLTAESAVNLDGIDLIAVLNEFILGLGDPALSTAQLIADFETDHSLAEISLNGATVNATNINLSATSTITGSITEIPATDPGLFAGIPAFAAAIANVDSSAKVVIDGGAISASGDLTLSAFSDVMVTSIALADPTDTNAAVDAALSLSVVDSDAVTRITGDVAGTSGAATLTVGGVLEMTALNSTDVTTTADGTTGDSGVTLAMAFIDDTTRASIDGDVALGLATPTAINLTARSTTDSDTVANAAPQGASANSPEVQQFMSERGAATPDGNLTLAGALAINDITSTTLAFIDATSNISTSGALSLTSLNDSDGVATAEASTVDGGASGDGVAVALNLANVRNDAYLGGSVAANSIAINALMNTDRTGDGSTADDPDGVHSFAATATAGAGVLSVGTTGAFALNETTTTTRAQLQTDSSVNAGGGPVVLSAENVSGNTAIAQPEGIGVIGETGVGASLAINLGDNTTRAAIEDSAVLINAGDVSLLASGDHTMTTSALAGALATGTATAPSMALAFADNTTSARIGAPDIGNTLLTTGSLQLMADHISTVTTTADGVAAGNVAVGAALGLAVVDEDVSATTARAIDAGGPVSLSASSASSSDTNAMATAAGTPALGDNVDVTVSDLLAAFDPDAGTPEAAIVPAAQTIDGQVGTAAALAVNVVSSQTRAFVSDDMTATGNQITIRSLSDTDAAATADGTAVGTAATGVGAAAAINVVADMVNEAYIGSDATVTASGVSVEALMNLDSGDNDPDGVHSFSASATAGAGALNVGKAGAFALNTTTTTTRALLQTDSSVDTGAGPLALSAENVSANTATAQPEGIGIGDTGVGASLAINLGDNTTRAAIEDNAILINAGDVSLLADGDHTMTTTAEAGAAGGTAIGAAIGLSVSNGDTTVVIGTGTAFSVGALDLDAELTSVVTTHADGAAAGPGVGVGASFGLSVTEETARAHIGRDVTTTGNADLAAHIDATSATNAVASAAGADPGSIAVNALITNVADFVDTGAWLTQPLEVPLAATPDGVLGVAGAISLNIAEAKSESTIAGGVTLNIGGALTVAATTLYDASALADSTTVSTITGNAGAAAINIALPDAAASIAGNVTASSVNILTTVDGIASATAYSGAGASGVGVAGAFALNIGPGDSEASIAAGASVVTTLGDLVVQADNTSTNIATADATAAGFLGTGVGASMALNIASDTARAVILGSANVAVDTWVLANGDYTVDTTAEGGALGGTAIAPALALTILDNETIATLAAPGAIVSAMGGFTVRAQHRSRGTGVASGAAAGTDTAVGASLAVTVDLDTASASVAGSADVSGSATIETNLDSESEAEAVAGAMGAAAGGTSVDALVADLIGFAGDPAREWLTVPLDVPSAETPDGSLAVAAAAAVNVDLTLAQAQLDATGNVVSGGPLLIRTLSDVDASATASAKTVDDTLIGVGIGAGVAVNVATQTTEAFIAGTATAPTITVRTLMADDGLHSYSAEAFAGAGADATGLAGALAVNVATGTSEARIDSGAVLNLAPTGGMLSVQSAFNTENVVEALAKTLGDPTLGVGAAIAVNVALNDSQALIEDASVTDAGSIVLIADGNHIVTTDAIAGADTDAAFGGAFAVGVSNSDTSAEIRSAAAPLSIDNTVSVAATHTNSVTTTADAETAGADVGAGVSIAVTVGLDDTSARIARDLIAGGDISVSADSAVTTDAEASAGQNGGFGSLLVDEHVANALSLPVGDAGIPLVPAWVDILDDAEDGADVALPSIGLAGAISVNVTQPSTLAEIADNTSIESTTGSVAVGSSVANIVTSEADASAVGNTATAGLALAGNFAGGSNRAAIGSGASVIANGISVLASDVGDQTFTTLALAGAGGVGGGLAGSIAVNAGAMTTQAQVGANADLQASGDISVIADSDLSAGVLAGGGSLGGALGVGASMAVNLIQDLTEASIGNAQVDAGATISVQALSDQQLSAGSVAGSAAGLGSLAGSIAINTVVPVTRAFTDTGAQLNQRPLLFTPTAAQNIEVLAHSETILRGIAGAAGASLLANGSASVDVGIVEKDTLAYVGGRIDAGGNVFVDASSIEDLASITGTLGLSELISIAGSGSIQRLSVTTQAYVDSGADVYAAGSVVISADDASEIDASADSASLSGLVGAAGAALGVAWVDKVTEAFIAGADAGRTDPFGAPGDTLGAARVEAAGLLPAVAAKTGDFTITHGAESGEYGEIEAPLYDVALALAPVLDNDIADSVADILSDIFGFLTVVTAPSADASLTGQRIATPVNPAASFRGVAVTATSRDDIETVARGLSGAAGLGISPEISGSAAVVTNSTSAFIAAGAQTLSNETIRVAAGSDVYHMGIAGAASIGGLGTVGASGNLSLFDNLTQAYVAGSADAEKDVQIWATAKQDVLAIASGMAATTSSFGLNLSASLPVISLNSATHAFVDASGFVDAEGNVLVRALDDTDTDVISGQATFGTSGTLAVGGSAAVSLIDKDTRAWIGDGAIVNARGDTLDTISVFDGTASMADGFPAEDIHGLGVQAESSELIFSVAAAGGSGAGLAFTGSLGFMLVDSDTAAFVDAGAVVEAEDVNVSAVNDARTFGAAVNLLLGQGTGLGVAGGFDVGLFRNDTKASISGTVTAEEDVEVHALSRIEVDSFIAAVGTTDSGISVVASVGLYSIRAPFEPIFGLDLLSFLSDIDSADTVQSVIDQQIFSFADTAGDGIGNLLNQYAQGVGGGNAAANAISAAAPVNAASSATQDNPVQFNPASAVDNTLETINLGANHGLVSGDEVAYSTAGGSAIGGLVDGGKYFVSVDASDPTQVRLHQTREDALAATAAINLDSTAAAGTGHSLSRLTTGTQARITGGLIDAGGNIEVSGEEVINAASDSSFTFNFDFNDSAILALANDRTILSTGGEAGGWIEGGATVSAVGTVTVRGDVENEQVLAGTTVVNGTRNTVKAVIDNASVSAADVDLLAASTTNVAYSALLPALSLSTTFQSKSADSLIATEVDAHIANGAIVLADNDVTVRARDRGEINVLANAATIKKEGLAVGAAIVTNDVGNTVTAYIDGSSVTASAGLVDVSATSFQDIQSIALGIAASGSDGNYALGGSFASNNIHNTIEAYVDGGTVNAAGDVRISAADSDGADVTNILSITGGAALTLGKLSIGAAVSTNDINNIIRARIDGGADVSSVAGNVELEATSDAEINAYAIGVSAVAGDNARFTTAGSVTLNNVGNTIEALVADGSTVTAASGNVILTADDHSAILADAGGFAVAIATDSSSGAIGASVAVNTITTGVRSGIEDSTVNANGVILTATGGPSIEALSVAGTVASSSTNSAFGGAGSWSSNDIDSSIEALILNSTVTASGDLSLAATDASVINADAGSGAVSIAVLGDSTQAGVAAGAAAAVNDIQTTARAAIVDSTVNVGAAADIAAISTADIDAFTLGIAGSLAASSGTSIGIVGAGSGSGNSVTNTIEAAVRGSTLTTGTNTSLRAVDNSSINALAGSAAVSIAAGSSTNVGVGLGFSMTVNEINNNVLAIIDDSDVTSGADLSLSALSTATIDATAFGAAVSVAAGSSTSVAVGATGAVADNSISNSIRAAIEDSNTLSDDIMTVGGVLSLSATDNSTIGAFGFAGSIGVGVGSTGVGGSLGIGTAFNTIDNQVAAYINNINTVDVDNGVSISAMSDSGITANSWAAAISVSVGDSSSVAVSGGGAIAQNVILSTTNAYIEDSSLDVGTPVIDAGIDIDANSISLIEAKVLAFSGSVAAGGGTSVAASIGTSVARNFIGWDPSGGGVADYNSDQQVPNIIQGDVVEVNSGPRAGDFYEYVGEDKGVNFGDAGVDLVIEDYGNAELWKLVSLTPDAVQVRAFIRDSGIDATAAVTLDAISSETIEAVTVAGSVAIAAGGSTSVGATGAGVYTENRVSSDIRAFIDGDIDVDTTDVLNAGSVALHASDSAIIKANAVAPSIGGAFGTTGVAVSIGTSTADNEVTNQVDAYIANVDGGTIVGDLVIDARSLPNNVGLIEDYDTDGGTQVLQEGNLVKVVAGHSAGGEVDRIYKFRGYADFLSTDGGQIDDSGTPGDDGYVLHLLTGSLIAEVDGDGEKTGRIFELVETGHDADNPLVVGRTQTIDGLFNLDTDTRFQAYSVDLGAENFTDTRFWETADANIVARSSAASLGVGAGTTGVAISGAGALALNVIGSGTDAYIKDSTLDSVGGKVDIDAQNSSSIAAIVGAVSAAVGVGQTGVGVSIGAAVAINKIGFDLDGNPLPMEVQSYIEDSSINADGALTLDAHANQEIDAMVLAGSVAVAVGQTGVAVSGSGVFASNQIGADVNAYILGDAADGDTEIIEAGSIAIHASDNSVINTVAGAASAAVAVGQTGVAVSIGGCGSD